MTTARTLVLLRHARAEDGLPGRDEVRALSIAGRAQAADVGRQLAALDLNPDLVLCSSAVRTRTTWGLVAQNLQVEPEVQFHDGLYNASPQDVLAGVRTVDPRVRSLLVVGHEPAVSMIAGSLAGQGSDPAGLAQVRVGVPTATFMVLRSSAAWSDWSNHCAKLEQVVRPGR